MNEKTMAPWTRRQVKDLNDFQRSGVMHPFTCGQRDGHPHNPGILVAMKDGWWCPAEGCGYRQDWAHAFMADRRMWETLRVFPAAAGEACSPEQEIAVLKGELDRARRREGAARNRDLQLRQQLKSAEDELGRLRRTLVERPADEARFAVALEALTAALNHDQEYVLLADRERAARAVVAALNGMAWAA